MDRDSPLTLRLGLVDIITPDINPMPPDEHGISIRILIHGLLQELCEILLMGRVLDHGDPQRIVVSEVPNLAHALAEALDLLDIVDLEDLVLLVSLSTATARSLLLLE